VKESQHGRDDFCLQLPQHIVKCFKRKNDKYSYDVKQSALLQLPQSIPRGGVNGICFEQGCVSV